MALRRQRSALVAGRLASPKSATHSVAVSDYDALAGEARADRQGDREMRGALGRPLAEAARLLGYARQTVGPTR
jgi:hypothetical protein